jgi:hypothetical protein
VKRIPVINQCTGLWADQPVCFGVKVSDEAERSLLVKLKTECGYQFTSKLESMFTDIKTSRDTMMEFRNRAEAGNGLGPQEDIEISVQVNLWWSVNHCAAGDFVFVSLPLSRLSKSVQASHH